MSTKGIIQASLELWGSSICLILLFASMLDKEYKGGSKRYLPALYVSVGLTLLFDALAWVFRGWPGVLGYVMVQVCTTETCQLYKPDADGYAKPVETFLLPKEGGNLIVELSAAQ